MPATTLKELREKIRCEQSRVDIEPFSHNIIALCLQQIDNEYGRNEANKAIDDFNLGPLGWSHVLCEHCGYWPCGCGG